MLKGLNIILKNPDFYREITESKYSFQVDDEAILDPRSLTPVERARNKKTRSKTQLPPVTNAVQVCNVTFKGKEHIF